MEVRGLFCCQIIVFGIALLVQNCVGFCFRANLMAEMTGKLHYTFLMLSFALNIFIIEMSHVTTKPT
jgi:hypothetical protein